MRNVVKEWSEGHVTVTVRGKRFERLINLAVREGLTIWNITRKEPDLGQCEMMIADFHRLRPLLKETGCRVHVENRNGLPFLLLRMRARAGFVMGIFLFLIGLYMLSTFVWQIEVQGTQNIPPQTVLRAAGKAGLQAGSWKWRMDNPQVLQQRIKLDIPKASYVAVEIIGTKAIIQVVEKVEGEKPIIQDSKHIVAKKKAVIHSIFAETGKTMVKVDQYVEPGQVLISGIIGNDQRQALVPANGKVEGEVWYRSEVIVPLIQNRLVYTGEKQKRHYLLAGSNVLRIWPFETITYKHEKKTEKRYQPSFFDFSLPIGWKMEIDRELEPQIVRMTEQEAIEVAKRFARKDILKQAGEDAKIKEEKVLHVKQENGKVYISIYYSVIENIAMDQPIIPQVPKQEAGQSNQNN
ncbi:sporulation protein YqfD [Brevibacillus daliensis]|uniref:sporulation protein YqfD n=1 Tax=Brevibacillus daliensis TaxID=2892995 RepID=UPI001E454DCD|nr:sporulation protein YqfD [Brevibacillus daliensis]